MTTTQDLRALLDEGRCLCSHADTDWQGVASLLDRLAAAEAERDDLIEQRDRAVRDVAALTENYVTLDRD